MFFDIYKRLCEEKGISCKKAACEIGLSNSITTKWKKTGATPSGETLERIAAYFGVTTDYLLGKPTVMDLFAGHGGLSERMSCLDDKPTKKVNYDGSEILFALSRGGQAEITDEMYEEVKRFAEYVAQRQKEK